MLNAALWLLRIPNISYMPDRECRPDVLIIGAPKAGTTACTPRWPPADLRLPGQGAEVLHVR